VSIMEIWCTPDKTCLPSFLEDASHTFIDPWCSPRRFHASCLPAGPKHFHWRQARGRFLRRRGGVAQKWEAGPLTQGSRSSLKGVCVLVTRSHIGQEKKWGVEKITVVEMYV